MTKKLHTKMSGTWPQLYLGRVSGFKMSPYLKSRRGGRGEKKMAQPRLQSMILRRPGETGVGGIIKMDHTNRNTCRLC